MYYFRTSFSWDPNKAATNARKHRVTFEEAVTVFDDPAVHFEEDAGSTEDRYGAIGYSEQARMLLVVFLEVGGATVRLISARKATKHERKRYQEGQSKA